jgi:hypothetical protein
MTSGRRQRQKVVSSTVPGSSAALWCRIAIADCSGTTIATWTVAGAGSPDLGVVDRIARLRLDSKDRGQTLVLSEVCPDLAALIRFAGLADVLIAG